jgi:hypothetical protein
MKAIRVIIAAALLAIPSSAKAHNFNEDCNDLAFLVARQEANLVHANLPQAYADAEIILSWIDMMVSYYGGARDTVIRQCVGAETPQAWWAELKRQADSYIPPPPPPPPPAQGGSIMCDPVVPGMPIVCRPFPAR